MPRVIYNTNKIGEMKMKEKVIGKLVLVEDEVYTNRFEVASWYEDVLVPAGEYDITYSVDRKMCFIRLNGKIIDADFSTLYGGMTISSNKNNQNKIGKQTSVFEMYYDFNIAELAHNHPNKYVLNKDIEIIAKLVDRGDGTSYTSYRLSGLKD